MCVLGVLFGVGKPVHMLGGFSIPTREILQTLHISGLPICQCQIAWVILENQFREKNMKGPSLRQQSWMDNLKWRCVDSQGQVSCPWYLLCVQ